MKFNILIIGGGIIGASIAYFLAESGQAGEIGVIEPDPTYQKAASSVGAGGVRQLFSQPENIEMSKFSLDFYKSFPNRMGINGTLANIDFSQCGYLFLVGERGARQLKANQQRQTALGVNAVLLNPDELGNRFPSLGLGGVALACFSPEDGTLNTTLALNGFRQKAASLGVQFITNKVVGLSKSSSQVEAAELASGQTIKADIFINAAGAWASEVSALIDMPLPIQPLCRVKHYWEATSPIEPTPLIKDESGVFFRQEGKGYVGGRPSWEVPPGFHFREQNGEISHYFDGYFEQTVRPLLSNIVPAFKTVHSPRAWTGHYAQNELDGNMILGNWPQQAENFFVACGFSGHGVMHAPAVGMAMAELVLNGRFATIDLSRMSYQRVIDNNPYPEQGII
ncbi:MAG: FAD-dependent oxidoreductase [Chloroflexota bacterium]